jgi:hypothetical protein
MFDVKQFLEEHGSGYDTGGFRGEVLRTKFQGGFGVFAGKQSKFFAVADNKLSKIIKGKAEAYAAEIAGGLSYEPKVAAAIQQVWFTPILNKEKQPNWAEGKWEEMRRYTAVQVNGEWKPTGDWVLFQSQWEGDNPPVAGEQFGKELWVHATYRQHPDFDVNAPTKYTAQVRDGQFELDDKGNPRPALIRVVNQVIGETQAEAEAWLAQNGGGSGNTAPATDGASDIHNVQNELMALYALLPQESFSKENWQEWSGLIFASVHNKESIADWVGVGVPQEVLDKVVELAGKYPAF